MAQSNSGEAKARKQALRVARREKADRINAVLLELQVKTYEMLEAAAEELEFDVEELRRLFLANNTFSGSKFIQYVVERIKDEGLYDKMSKQEEAHYVEIAQTLRDSKLSIGSARTATHRKTPGNVYAELESMGKRLLHLHDVTGIEGMLVAVRGNEKDGMNPIYVSSPKAQTFLESHLKVDADHFVTLMECSAIGGASAVALRHRTDTQIIKSNVRIALLDSLRKAATSMGSDGSEPTTTNPLTISAISYTDYVSFIDQYKVEVFNWPMNGDKMVDPSNVGGHKILSSYLKLIESGKAGFRRMPAAEWEAWKQARDEADVVVPTKRPSRKRANASTGQQPSAEQQPKAKKARKETSKAKAKPRVKAKSNRKGKASGVETASEGATEASSSDVPADNMEPASDYCSNNDLGAHTGSPSPMVPLPLPTVSNTGHNFVGTAPDSPPIDERFRITINRRPTAPSTPPTPSTVTDTIPSSSPNFLLHPVMRQPQYNGGLPDCSQGSPSRGRRSYRHSWDRPFINHTPDSISSGRPASRSTSLASRSNSPAHSTRSQNKTHVPMAASSPTQGPPSLPLLTNDPPNTGEFFTQPTLHLSTPLQFSCELPSDQFGLNVLANQDALLPSEWNFGGLHAPLLVGLVPELRSTTPALSEFAAPDA
ncbi:hypothetical protein FRC10_000342 [Ceratobasidium sp. 414]|nr:hypothetical protein FRC10_000342 [Ceratobasidium sp. 414]